MVQTGVILVVFFAGVGLGVMLAGLVLARDVQATRAERRRLLEVQTQMFDDAASTARRGEGVVSAMTKLPALQVGFWMDGVVVDETGQEVTH